MASTNQAARTDRRSRAVELPPDPSLDDLLRTLELSPETAEIRLNGERMVLVDNASLGILRREVILALGHERARAVMSRLGYSLGAADAEMGLRLRKDEGVFAGFAVGPQLHALRGAVKVEPTVFEADLETGHFYSEYFWHNSAECQAHKSEMGIGPEPGGWQQVGYASGYASAFLGRPVVFREVECVAMGHERCFLIGKPADQWEDPEKEARWFRAENYTSRPAVGIPGAEPPDDLRIGHRSIVGASSGFNIALHLVDKVAPTNAPVLFLGESGVGKEVFARELHKRSRRSGQIMLSVNCAAIPDTLIESELFGVEKGAFTGATASRAGRFERARGGTLFLDEIGTLSLSAQGKLLRVLQEGEFERIGGLKTLTADVRIVAATNADLRSEIAEGRFRADLFHRLSTFPIRVPPLRERPADIPLLVNYFLRLMTARHGRRVTGFQEEALRFFRMHDWPGNIRELENTIERGVIMANDGEAIGLSHLMMAGGRISSPDDASLDDPLLALIVNQLHRPKNDGLAEQILDRGIGYDAMLAEMIDAALSRNKGNVSAAARALKMSRSQLVYWLKTNKPAPVAGADIDAAAAPDARGEPRDD